jgi:hypothetical protein
VVKGVATRRSDSVRAAARDFWQLPDDALDQLLTLSREADRVELKLTVPGPARDAACAALGVDFARVRADRVYYLDTEDRTLHRQGVVVRVRSIARGPDDSSSSCARSARAAFPRPCGSRGNSSSRSTRCPAASSAPAR